MRSMCSTASRPRAHGRRLALAAGVLLAGCSSFDRDWEALGPYPGEHRDITGRWSGSWSCDETGHSGELRCLVSRLESDLCAMRYRARWGGIFTSEYTVLATVEPDEGGGGYRFGGSKDLGWLAGGLCRYDGRATATEFEATYTSSSNEGVFRMARPAEESPSAEDP